MDIVEKDENESAHANERAVTVSELIRKCQERAHSPNTNASNRLLLFNCAYAMRQLVDRLGAVMRENAELRGIKEVESAQP